MAAGWADQTTAQVRCEWGPAGIAAVPAEVVVVIDVLRFSTATETAVAHGLAVHPYRWRDESSARFASSVGAVLADGAPGAPSLSPDSLLALDPGTRVVLPSPNGSTCAVLAAEAGAVIAALGAETSRSPEAAAAEAVWRSTAGDIGSVLAGCASGREQVGRGWSEDLAHAGQVDVSTCVPVLVDGVFVDASRT